MTDLTIEQLFNYAYNALLKSGYKPIQHRYVSYIKLKKYAQILWKHYTKQNNLTENINDNSNLIYATGYLKNLKDGHKILGGALKIFDEIACLSHLLLPINNKYYYIRNISVKITIILRTIHLNAAIHRKIMKRKLNVYLTESGKKRHNVRIKQLYLVNNILSLNMTKQHMDTCSFILKPWVNI